MIILLLALPLFAAKFWETKEFTAWTQAECMEMLTKSPWAYSTAFGQVNPAVFPGVPTDVGKGAPSMGQPPDFGDKEGSHIFEFRLLTAKPIRMAIAQLQLLKAPNDQTLKEKAKQMMNAAAAKEIVFQIGYRSVPPGSSFAHDAHSYFLHATINDFQTNTYLEGDKSGLISLADYLAPNATRSNAAFVFPRFNNKGEPLFTGNEKSISLRSELNPEIAGKKQQYKIFVKMNPKQMKFQNEFAF
jgi:hypothetical protein